MAWRSYWLRGYPGAIKRAHEEDEQNGPVDEAFLQFLTEAGDNLKEVPFQIRFIRSPVLWRAGGFGASS